MSENKRFLLERSDYDLKYEFRIADLSRVDKTKEDFWDEEEEMYNYRGIDGFLDYLYDNNAFLTQDEANQVLNELHEENQSLKEKIAFLEEFITSGVEYTYSQNIYEENEELKKQLKELQEFKDNYDRNMELIHNSEYVQDFLNGNL